MENPNVACGCKCHRVVGIFTTLIGLDILLGTLGVLDAKISGIVWPVLLILIGLRKSMRCKCCAVG